RVLRLPARHWWRSQPAGVRHRKGAEPVLLIRVSRWTFHGTSHRAIVAAEASFVVNELSPRLSLRGTKATLPEPTAAKSPDLRSQRNGRISEENRRSPRGGFPFRKPLQPSRRPDDPVAKIAPDPPPVLRPTKNARDSGYSLSSESNASGD